MSRTVFPAVLALLAIVGAFFTWQTTRNQPSAGFALLTDQEISERAAYPDQKARALNMTETNGPIIKVSSPVGFALNSPVNFDIRVEPRGGVAVDMTSFSIEYKLGPVWVNLTRRVMREAKIEGSHFRARGAELPPGNHSLRLTARDEKSRRTQALVTFSIAE